MRTEFTQMITELKDTVRSVKQLADQLTEKGLHYKPKPSAKPRPPPKSGRSR